IGGEISRGDARKLSLQLFAQRGRLLGIEGDRGLALAASTAISIAGRLRRHPRLVVLRLERAVDRRRQQRGRPITEIRGIKIVLAGDANKREQGVAASIGQGLAHSPRSGGLGGTAER